MIESKMSSRILTIGCDYKTLKGGVSQVINVYSSFFECFNFIPTVKGGDFFDKIVVFIGSIFKFIYVCATKKIDLVHIHASSNSSFYRKSIFVMLGKIFSIKVILHIHGGGFKEFYINSNSFLIKKIFKKCDLVITLSESWKDYFQNVIGLSNVCVVNNVISEPMFLENGEDREAVHFIFLGLICKDKGIYDVLSLIVKKKNEYEGKIFLHIGGNGEEDKLKKIIDENKLNSIVRFYGWVSGNKKVELLSTSDVFILPSYYEGLPIAILEAMSYKLPIITTPVGGIPEVVDSENGIIVTPGNERELEDAIEYMLNNAQVRCEMGYNSYLRSLLYCPKEVEKKLRELYSGVIYSC